MMWMDVDAALTEVPVNVLPLVDDATAKVIDEGVTYDEAGMALIWHFETTAGVNTATPVTPTTGGDYDWAHTDGGMYTIEMPATGGASANNDTEGFGYFTGNTTANRLWRGPTIGFRAAAINNALIDGGDLLDVSLVQIGGVVQSLTDFKDLVDTGYNPTTHVMQADLVYILAHLLTQTGTQVADAFQKFFDVGTPTGTVNSLPDAAPNAAGGLNTLDKLLAFVQLISRSDDAIETDRATELTQINTDQGSGAGDYMNETDALEGIRNRGDLAWLTGGAGGATESYTTSDWTRTVGDDDGGVGSDTLTVNGTYFATGEVNSTTLLEVDAVFTAGIGETALSIDFWGFYNGGGAHTISVQALDNTSSLYEPVGTIGLGTIVEKDTFPLSPGHINPATGVVNIKFIHVAGTGTVSHVFNIDKAQVNTSIPSTTAEKMLAYIQLLARSDSGIETDRSTELGEINTDEGSGAGDYSAQTDSQEQAADLLGNGTYGLAKLVRSTTPANTLDVSAGGEAGMDWANIGGKTSTVDLTNTTIGNVTLVLGLDDDIVDVDAVADGTLTTAKFAADFLDHTLIADNAFRLEHFQDACFDAANFATDVWTTSADALLKRDVSNVEATAADDTLCGAILAALHWKTVGANILVYQTDNITLFMTLPITTDPDAEPVVQVTG